LAAMALVRGTIIKTSNAKPWWAKFADGSTAGPGQFASLTDAKKVIEAAAGGRFLVWTMTELPGPIEHYTGTDPNS
jgi:hypothetical protein